MPNTRKLISFDWAIKRILRSKANFEILEILESEGNQSIYTTNTKLETQVIFSSLDFLKIAVLSA
jgi:hypothetical protein